MNSQANMESNISREAMAAVKRSFSIWMPWALYLLPLSCVGQLLSLTAIEQHKLNDAISQTSIPGSLFTLLTALLCPYVFGAVYLRAEPITISPPISVGGYFHWLWKIIQKYFICMFLPLVIGIILAVLSASMKSKLIPIFAVLAVFPFTVFVMVRLQCVGPLALSNDRSPIKTSRDITHGHCWRLIGHSFLFGIKFFFIYILLPAIIMIAAIAGTALILKNNPSKVLIENILISVFVGSFTAVGAAAGTVFACVATNILYRERHLKAIPLNQQTLST